MMTTPQALDILAGRAAWATFNHKTFVYNLEEVGLLRDMSAAQLLAAWTEWQAQHDA